MAKASDNLFPKVIVVEGAAPSSPSAGNQTLYIDSADHKLKRKNSAGTVTIVEGSGGTGQGLVDFAKARRTSGDITLNNSAWTNIDTGLDLVMSASTSDVIEVKMMIRVIGSNYCVLDFHTMVGGSPVNSIAQETVATATTGSHPGWGVGVVPSTPGIMLTGSKRYTLLSGDISSGTVTLRLRGRSGASQTIAGNGDPALYVECTNLGPQL